MFVGTMLLSLSAYAQTGGVKGKVVSRDGREAISGVAISVDGVAVNTTTNEDGEFIIEGLAPGVFSGQLVADGVVYLEIRHDQHRTVKRGKHLGLT